MERESEKKFVEESGLTFSDVPKLCVKNCGFFGNSATNNLCSKCYKDDLMKRSKALVVEKTEMGVEEKGVDEPMGFIGGVEEEKIVKIDEGTTSENRPANRCSFCRKRVGLMGFKCRCEHTFCSIHRYSDKHNCRFDYKVAGQDAIAKSNPVVKADKLEKI